MSDFANAAALAVILAKLDKLEEQQDRLLDDMCDLFNELRKSRLIEGMPDR